MDDTEPELTPQNPNPRGAHNTEEEKDYLDEIIRAFNDRLYTDWEDTPEKARVKGNTFSVMSVITKILSVK